MKKNAEDLVSIHFILEQNSTQYTAEEWDSILSNATAGLEEGKNIAEGIFLARDIVNAPHNVMNSDSMANTAKKIAKESNGLITCDILGKHECEKRGMGAFLGVARGSETDPQFIHLTYKGNGTIR